MLSTNSLVENFPGPISVFSNQISGGMNEFNKFEDSSSSPSSGTSSSGGASSDVNKYSNPILRYISDILMDEEDDLERKPCMLQECLRLQAAERSFYDALSHNNDYPSQTQGNCFYDEIENNPDGINYGPSASFESNGGSSTTTENSYESDLVNLVGEFESSLLQSPTLDSPENTNHVVTWNAIQSLQSQPLMMGEDGSDSSAPLRRGSREKRTHQVYDDISPHEPGGRSSKLLAVFSDNDSEAPEILDEVLKYQTGRTCGTESSSQNSKLRLNVVESGGGSSVKGKANRSSKKKGSSNKGTTTVDLWTLLTQCAQAVANYDQRNANGILKQIRQHSSPFGDGLQRLAHYFTIGLETRLAAGTPAYYVPHEMASAADMLKAYKLFVTASPLQRVSNFLATKTILSLVKDGSGAVHIIDFGICYGFQWPCLIKLLSERQGGAPKLRVTGIELPQPGFRPAERVEETGRRLENYCRKFNVPFEYHCLAQKWETIRLEDLSINSSEITVVNCLYRMKNVPDETVAAVNCPRDAVLKLIRKINPNIFIHGIVNGSYSAPFFLTRFREALFHFSSQFDMYEANVPREDPERLMLEKGLFGKDAINVIACEGVERVERPETYKQWQVRNKRAGFRQVRFDPELVHRAEEMVKMEYHKDFVVDQDGKWVLQGWKGRILNALSAWVPA